MKIAVFIKGTTFHKTHGGLEVQNKILCEGLVQKGHEVVVYTPCQELELESKHENGVTYKFIKAKYKNLSILQSVTNMRVKSEWHDKSFNAFWADHMQSPFQVAVSQSSAGLGLIRKKDQAGIKVLAICHGTILSEYKTLLSKPKNIKSILRLVKDLEYTLRTYFTTQREFINGADKVVCVSKFVKRNVADEAQLNPESVEVIYNGVKDLYGSNKVVVYPIPVLYVGRVESEKGVFELIKLFSELVDKNEVDIKLNVVGDGPDLEKAKVYAQQLAAGDKVEFSGYKKGDDLTHYYNISKLFVLPTKRVEGFPVTLSEAMMAGLPVVGMDKGGISEGIVDGETGYLISPGDWKDFQAKMEHLLKNDKRMQTFSANSRRRAQELFSEEKMIESYENLLVKISKP